MNLGVWNAELAAAVQQTWGSSCIFPMGAVAKKIGSDMRPTDDHTRTGLNAATDMSRLRHTLETYKEISTFFKHGYFMRGGRLPAAPAPSEFVAILHVSVLRLGRVNGALTVCPPVRRFWGCRHARYVQDFLRGCGGQHGPRAADSHAQYADIRRRLDADRRQSGAS
eukprot:7376537-Prymnesium_polylepis.2